MRSYGRCVTEATHFSETLQRERDASFRWLMTDRRGRRVVWRLLGEAGIFHSSMASTPEATAFNEGRRSTGLALLADISRLCPERFAEMQQEAHVEEMAALRSSTPIPTAGEADDARDHSHS